uniref:Uncharacterized protein n=1 Tax=Bracon brevicornis TaxID=1563983 RepID=A0A6V7KDY0_9HYME
MIIPLEPISFSIKLEEEHSTTRRNNKSAMKNNLCMRLKTFFFLHFFYTIHYNSRIARFTPISFRKISVFAHGKKKFINHEM